MALKKWQGYRSELASEQYDAIIIGSGISGLTCAALLAQEGKKVLALKKHFRIGNYTHIFSMSGMWGFITWGTYPKNIIPPEKYLI